MNLQTIFVVMFFVTLGLLLVCLGIWLLRGNGKRFYFAKHIYASGVYLSIPGGIACFWFGMGAFVQSPTVSSIFVNVGNFFGLVGVVFSVMAPSFLKPQWLRYLNQEHGDILHLLENEANQMGLMEWEHYVDRNGLETWVAEVRLKNGLPEKPTPAER